MDRSLKYYWFIAIFAGIIILFSQVFYIMQLYQHEKTTYVTQQNERITNAIYEFNMKMADPKQTISFNPATYLLTYIINDKILRFQLIRHSRPLSLDPATLSQLPANKTRFQYYREPAHQFCHQG